MSHERRVRSLVLFFDTLWIINCLFARIGGSGGNHASSDRFAYQKRQEPRESGALPASALEIGPCNVNGATDGRCCGVPRVCGGR